MTLTERIVRAIPRRWTTTLATGMAAVAIAGVVLAIVTAPVVMAQPQAAGAPPAGPVEIRSVEVVDEMPDVGGRIWRPAEPEKFQAVVIRTRVARGSEYPTSDFLLEYEAGGRKARAVCAGVTARIPDGWAINEEGVTWSFFPGGTGTLDGLGLLFVVPRDASKGTLFFKDKSAGETFEIKLPQV